MEKYRKIPVISPRVFVGLINGRAYIRGGGKGGSGIKETFQNGPRQC